MRVVLDAMGTDKRPVPDVAGGVLAAKEFGDTIILVGDKTRIKAELNNHQTNGLKIEIHHATDVIPMDELPSEALKARPASSITMGLNLVKDQQADAFVTMGNTGATHGIATLKTLRRIPKVKRPALSAIFPIQQHRYIFVDVGANTDVKPEWLYQFGIMGSAYAKTVHQVNSPRIAVMSNGEEEGKGNQALRSVAEMLYNSPLNFVGNIEPQDLREAVADVVVMDGFIGNLVLKTFEASATYFADLVRAELKKDLLSTVGAILSRRAFNRVRQAYDTTQIGGAPLLGVNGVVIIGHGNSDAETIKNAIGQARQAVLGNTIQAIEAELQAYDIDSKG